MWGELGCLDERSMHAEADDRGATPWRATHLAPAPCRCACPLARPPLHTQAPPALHAASASPSPFLSQFTALLRCGGRHAASKGGSVGCGRRGGKGKHGSETKEGSARGVGWPEERAWCKAKQGNRGAEGFPVFGGRGWGGAPRVGDPKNAGGGGVEECAAKTRPRPQGGRGALSLGWVSTRHAC